MRNEQELSRDIKLALEAAKQANQNAADLMIMLGELRESQREEKKTYPIGFDPKGEWCVIYNKAQEKYFAISLDGFYTEWTHVLPEIYTTRDQAEKKAAGLNIIKKLIKRIHELEPNNSRKNIEYRLNGQSGYIGKSSADAEEPRFPEKLRFCIDTAIVLRGEFSINDIKLALEWGM